MEYQENKLEMIDIDRTVSVKNLPEGYDETIVIDLIGKGGTIEHIAKLPEKQLLTFQYADGCENAIFFDEFKADFGAESRSINVNMMDQDELSEARCYLETQNRSEEWEVVRGLSGVQSGNQISSSTKKDSDEKKNKSRDSSKSSNKSKSSKNSKDSSSSCDSKKDKHDEVIPIVIPEGPKKTEEPKAVPVFLPVVVDEKPKEKEEPTTTTTAIVETSNMSILEKIDRCNLPKYETQPENDILNKIHEGKFIMFFSLFMLGSAILGYCNCTRQQQA